MEKQQYVPFIVVSVDVVLNNIKVFGIAMEMQKRVPLSLLSHYKTFHIVVNNNKDQIS
jgi:hypothetical protein